MNDIDRLRTLLASRIGDYDEPIDSERHRTGRGALDMLSDASGTNGYNCDESRYFWPDAAARFALWLLNNPTEAIRVIEGDGNHAASPSTSNR